MFDGSADVAATVWGLIPVAPWILSLAGLGAGCGQVTAFAGLFGGRDDGRAAGSALGLGLTAITAACSLALADAALASGNIKHALSPRLAGWLLLTVLLLAEIIRRRRDRKPQVSAGATVPPRFGRFAPAIRAALRLALLGTSSWVAIGSGADLPVDAGVDPATTWVGALAIASSAAMGLAAAALTGRRLEGSGADAAVHRLQSLLGWTILVQASLVAGLMFALGPASELAFGTGRGQLVPLGLIPVGLVAPSVLLSRAGHGRRWTGVAASLAVLAGGFALRLGLDGLPTPLLAYPH